MSLFRKSNKFTLYTINLFWLVGDVNKFLSCRRFHLNNRYPLFFTTDGKSIQNATKGSIVQSDSAKSTVASQPEQKESLSTSRRIFSVTKISTCHHDQILAIILFLKKYKEASSTPKATGVYSFSFKIKSPHLVPLTPLNF